MNMWEFRQWYESQWSIELATGFAIAVIIGTILLRWYLDRGMRR